MEASYGTVERTSPERKCCFKYFNTCVMFYYILFNLEGVFQSSNLNKTSKSHTDNMFYGRKSFVVVAANTIAVRFTTGSRGVLFDRTRHISPC